MSNFLKSTVIRDGVLPALSQMLRVAPTVWRDAGGSHRGAAGDTITLRVPAYTTADTRALRSGASRNRRGLFETPVPITLDTDIYRDVVLTDENLTLDILDFSRQVLNPMLESVARKIEQTVITEALESADYEHTVAVDEDNPFSGIVQARKRLNDSNVPDEGRTLAVGSSVEALLIESSKFSRVDQSGTSQTLRRGIIGDIAGFNVVSVPGLDPDKAYAYHKTAYALSCQAPLVPQGAPSGFTATQDGFAIRVVQVLDSDRIENVVAADCFVGAAPVNDYGTVDEKGRFTPAENYEQSGVEELFVRGVELTLSTSE